MKSIESIYNEIKNNKELQAEMIEAAKNSKIAEFFRKHGCEADLKEISEFVKSLAVKDELSDNDLDNVVGGANLSEAVWSICSLGLLCVEIAIISACGDGVGDGDDGRILCNNELG